MGVGLLVIVLGVAGISLVARILFGPGPEEDDSADGWSGDE